MTSLSTLNARMTHAPYSIAPDMTIRVAIELMRRHGIRHPPVEEGERLVGLLSDRHIIASERGGHLEPVLDLAVSEIMEREPLRLRQDTPVEEAIRRMRAQRCDGVVLVVDDREELAGIFTERDALILFAEVLGADSGATTGAAARELDVPASGAKPSTAVQ